MSPRQSSQRRTPTLSNHQDNVVGAVNDNDAADENQPFVSHATMTEYLTKTRVILTPYLPPPVISAMKRIDSLPFFQRRDLQEPSMTILLSVLLVVVLWRFTVTLGTFTAGRGGGGAGGGRKIARSDEEDDDDHAANVLRNLPEKKTRGGGDGVPYDYDDTVVLCGPTNAGKTVLFHMLCCSPVHDDDDTTSMPVTVTSMRANGGFVIPTMKDHDDQQQPHLVEEEETTTTTTTATTTKPVRLVDYPGHAALQSQLPTILSMSNRVVFVLDSTKPITDAAELLYTILTDPILRTCWSNNDRKKRGGGTKDENNNKMPILIVCNKSNLPGSKNWRRIKIQLRTELERLRKVKRATAGDDQKQEEEEGSGVGKSSLELGIQGKSLDLDDLGPDIPVKLHFLSVGWTSEGNDNSKEHKEEGIEALREFVLTGKIVLSSGNIISASRARKE